MLSAFGAALLYGQQTGVTKLQLWAAIGAIAGVFLFLRGFSMLRCKRLIMNTPSSKIRSASMGLVEISGTAKGPHTVPAAITGEACYYYRAMAWQLKYSGRNRQWEKVADESLYVPFFIEDATGEALVDPQGAELDIHCNFKDELGGSAFSSGMMPENASRFVMRYGIPTSEKIRVEEYCIKPGDPLFVLGTLGQNTATGRWTPIPHMAVMGSSFKSRLNFFGPGGSSMFRALGWASGMKVPLEVNVNAAAATQSASLTARSWSSVSLEEEAMHAMAGAPSRDATGTVASNARETVSASASVETEAALPETDPNAQSAMGFNMNPTVAIGKGTNHEFFMISWHSQREVVQSLAWKSALCIWGGPALTLTCVYFLILSLGWT